jgi:hypothetical protein
MTLRVIFFQWCLKFICAPERAMRCCFAIVFEGGTYVWDADIRGVSRVAWSVMAGCCVRAWGADVVYGRCVGRCTRA